MNINVNSIPKRSNNLFNEVSNLRKKVYGLYPKLSIDEISEMISLINSLESDFNKQICNKKQEKLVVLNLVV